MAGLPRAEAIATALLLLACDGAGASSAMDARPEPAPTVPSRPPAPITEPSAPSGPAATPEATVAAVASSDAPPVDDHPRSIGRRRARRAQMVYVEPRLGTAFRGKIPRNQIFELQAHVTGDDCGGEGWGRIGDAAYVCLQHTEPVEDEPSMLPATLVDGLAPFFYARLRPKDGSGQQPPAPRYRSRRAMAVQAPPEDYLEPEHDYAFVERRRFHRQTVLTTETHRTVRERDVKRMKPSEFRGRDIAAHPIPAGTVMMWSIEWPYAIVHAEPSEESPELDRLPLHAEALAHDRPPDERGEHDAWIPVARPEAGSTSGWVLAEQVRHWIPMPPPDGITADELWIDIDLAQQMLALRRGPAVEFLTLISSGNGEHPTPVGLFRLESKWAFADMRSRAGDEDTYFVEGVPWVQYFRGRYALHGTFWHNRFGRRTSHGCINLSAHDARWVYERTWPAAKPGWLMINEHAREPGTTLRIRKGTRPPPDRRGPLPGA